VPISVRSVANTDNTGREFHLPRFVLKRNGGRFLRIGKRKVLCKLCKLGNFRIERSDTLQQSPAAAQRLHGVHGTWATHTKAAAHSTSGETVEVVERKQATL
jgi:hypothetical protein